MSLIPMLFSNWWEDLDRPHHLFDQNFGLGLNTHDLVRELRSEPNLLVYRPGRRHRQYHPYEKTIARRSTGGLSTLQSDKDKFQVNLDVQQFSPEEINVKVSGRHVVVEGKHEEKQDEHGFISRQFVRRYLIPEQCEIDEVESHLSSDGVLTITAPKKKALEDKSEKIIPIQQTGQPAITDVDAAKSNESKEPTHKTPVTRAQDKASKTVKAA